MARSGYKPWKKNPNTDRGYAHRIARITEPSVQHRKRTLIGLYDTFEEADFSQVPDDLRNLPEGVTYQIRRVKNGKFGVYRRTTL